MVTHALRVLVADDQPLTTWALATALASRGHEVVTAGTRDEACARLFQQHFDVVVMSSRIEERDMSDVLRDLTRYPSATRLVMLCDGDDAGPTPPVPPRAVAMARPFDLATLLAAVSPTDAATGVP